MSIIIKGIEMPKDCDMLIKIYRDGVVGLPTTWTHALVLKDAVAYELPPHGDLIDRDELENHYAMCFDADGCWHNVLKQRYVDHAPVIIPGEEKT